MRFLFLILPLFYSACSVLPIALGDFIGGAAPPAVPPTLPPDEVERFHSANAGKYFAFEVYRNSSANNMAIADNPSAGTVVQFLLFRFNGDGTLQSVLYNNSPFESSDPDTNLDTSPAFYSKKTKTYGETSAPINPANPEDPNRQWGIRKVRFINDFTRVQVAEDILGQGDWAGRNLVDVPLVIGTKTEVFAQYGMP